MVDFSPELHRDFITRRGEAIRWYLSKICPCRDPVSGQHDRSCDPCDGAGFLYDEQDVSDYRALVRQVDQREEFAKFGQIYVGDITLTTMPDEIAIGEGDLVDLTSRRFRHEEVVQADGGSQTKLAWTPVEELLAVSWLEATYEIGVDVRLSTNSDALYWTGTPPAAGTRISVVYNWTPRYIVIPSMITTRRVVEGTAMPQRVVARLKNREDFRE